MGRTMITLFKFLAISENLVCISKKINDVIYCLRRLHIARDCVRDDNVTLILQCLAKNATAPHQGANPDC